MCTRSLTQNQFILVLYKLTCTGISNNKKLRNKNISEADLGLLQHLRWSSLRQWSMAFIRKSLSKKSSILDVAGFLDPPLYFPLLRSFFGIYEYKST